MSQEESTADRLLPASTSMAAPTLIVGDMELMSGYYSGAFAMEPLEERVAAGRLRRVLGRGDVPLIKLVEEPNLPKAQRNTAGLFHTAFVFATKAGLARTVLTAAQHPLTQFTGAADHRVSEAFYFTDPEGNGVELYVDRPRSSWHYEGGQVVVGTDPLDPNLFIREHLGEPSTEQAEDLAGRVGHVHLQVGDLATATPFYVDTLGFAMTANAPGALFASAGGYHHHVAVNTWNSRGAGPRGAALGLGTMAIQVPNTSALDALEKRLNDRALQFRHDGRELTVNDPWGTRITITASEPTAQQLLAR